MHIRLSAERHTLVTALVVIVVEGCNAVAAADKPRLMRFDIVVISYSNVFKPLEVGGAVAVALILLIANIPVIYTLVKGVVVQPDISALESRKSTPMPSMVTLLTFDTEQSFQILS